MSRKMNKGTFFHLAAELYLVSCNGLYPSYGSPVAEVSDTRCSIGLCSVAEITVMVLSTFLHYAFLCFHWFLRTAC